MPPGRTAGPTPRSGPGRRRTPDWDRRRSPTLPVGYEMVGSTRYPSSWPNATFKESHSPTTTGHFAVATPFRPLPNRWIHAPEFTGGTFTISNLGMYAVDHFTAIINPPEAAILAVGAATPTPVVRDGEVVVRAIIKLTLSVDHRVVDGAPAAAFLRKLKDLVQKPLADRELNAGGGPGLRSAFLLPTGGAGWCRPCPSRGGVRGILRAHRDCGRGCMAGRSSPVGR